MRAHRHLCHDPAFDVHRNLGGPGIVGDEDQLTIHVAGSRFRLETDRQVVGRLARRVRRLRQRHFKVGVGTANVLDFPGRAADVGHTDRTLGPLAEIDIAEIDERRIEGDVAADVARHPQLHFGIVGLVERDGDRGTVLAEKRSCVELGNHFGCFMGLEVAGGHLGRRAAAAGPHADDMQGLLVDVAKHEAVFRLRALGHRAEIMARGGEHLRGPFLRDGRVAGGDGQRQHASEEKRFASGHRSCGKHAGDTGSDEGCHSETSGGQE